MNLVACCLVLLSAVIVHAEASGSSVPAKEIIEIEGVVRQVSPDKNILRVKVVKGEKVKLRLYRQTDFVGLASLAELERGDRVRVWYREVAGENMVEKIEKLPALGC
ncbi:MAG: hypothetical protein ABFR97_08130 [Thermodesulfobacteriota bacterium]